MLSEEPLVQDVAVFVESVGHGGAIDLRAGEIWVISCRVAW